MVTVQQILGRQCLTDKEGSHLAPAHTRPGVYFHSLLLICKDERTRLVRITIAPHCVSASTLFHYRAQLVPCYIPQLAAGGLLSHCSHWVPRETKIIVCILLCNSCSVPLPFPACSWPSRTTLYTVTAQHSRTPQN